MCELIETHMACGHILQHLSSPKCHNPSFVSGSACSSWHDVASKTDNNNPKQQHISCGTRVKHRYINDTCARCDPAARQKFLRATYEYEHGLLMQEYITAKKEGDTASMARLEDKMVSNVKDVRAANFRTMIPASGLARKEQFEDEADKVLNVTTSSEI